MPKHEKKQSFTRPLEQIASFYEEHLLGINFVAFEGSEKRFANAVVFLPEKWLKVYDENKFYLQPIEGVAHHYDLCVRNPNLVLEADEVLDCLKNIVELNRAVESRKKAIQELYQKQQLEIAEEIKSLITTYTNPPQPVTEDETVNTEPSEEA